MSIAIGTTNFDGNKKTYFGLKANEDNLYRVLPPLFSLAEKGQYAKYYSTHSVWLKDPANPEAKSRPYHFECLEKVNRETKMIEQHCPFCDKAREMRVQYEAAREQGVDQEQLKTFLYNQVLPYQPKKKFYINAVNTDNKVGVLDLGIKAFRALQDRLNEVRNQFNLDATGMRGLFFNFRKTQKYKGDRDTIYTVDIGMESYQENGQFLSRFKEHSITEQFINTLETSARDLGTLYKSISAEDMALILNSTTYEGKKQVCDRLFGKSESVQSSTIPGTNAQAVGTVSLGANGLETSAPSPVAPSPLTPQVQAPVQQVAQAPVQQVAQAPVQVQQSAPAPTAQPGVPTSNMSDEDFINTFMG